MRSIAVISSMAFSLTNFRGPMIAALLDKGVRVFALAPDFDAQSRAAVRELGAEPVDFSLDRTGMHPLRDLRDMFSLAMRLRSLSPDACFAYFLKPVIYGSLAAKVAGVPARYAMLGGLGYVFTPNTDGMTGRRQLLRLLVSAMFGAAFRACRRVFLQNEDDLGLLVEAGVLPRTKAVLLNGTGIDLALYTPKSTPTDPVCFLLMARLLREKGIIEYVEAARRLKQRYPRARFILLGGADPNPGGIAEGEMESWSSDGAIEWHGHVDDVRPWIEASSVYVLPSYREGKPRSTQEAMAMARPVVTTDVPGCRNTVVDGVNGFLVPARDPQALADAMEKFLLDPSLIVPMGLASRRMAEEMFDVHRINRKILETMGVQEAAE